MAHNAEENLRCEVVCVDTDGDSAEAPAEGMPVDADEVNRRLADMHRQAMRELLEDIPEGYEATHTRAEAGYAAGMQELAAKHRGEYISLTTEVERQVNYVLVQIFAGSVEQQQVFARVVLQRSQGLSFSLKAELMADGLLERHPGLHSKFKGENLFTRMDAIRGKRNRLAHAAVDSSPEYVRQARQRWGDYIGETRFVGWSRRGRYEDTVTVEEMQKSYIEVNSVTRQLVDLVIAVHGARQTYHESKLETIRDD